MYKGPAVSISLPLCGGAPLSTPSLCRGYCEASAKPSSARWVCARCLCRWDGVPVVWTPAKVTHYSLCLAPLTQYGLEQKPVVRHLPCTIQSHVGQVSGRGPHSLVWTREFDSLKENTALVSSSCFFYLISCFLLTLPYSLRPTLILHLMSFPSI